MKQQSGFTLIEIAIVLVIIGLLLGGVLKGQEIITNAKIKNITNDFNGVSAAIYSYQDRYRATPGDDVSADLHVGSPAADNGNGNGLVDNTFESTNDANESRAIWTHLRAAGLVAGPSDGSTASKTQPPNAFGGVTGVESNRRNIPGLLVGFSDIPGDIAIILESQGDDGVPTTGSIQSTNGNAYTNNGVFNLLYGL